jgi:DNA-binding FrmR family transcriptional regulator
MNTKPNSDDVTNQVLHTRLARVEGQVRGVSRMLDEGQYCTDVIDQITAARRALERIALLVMRRHLNSCVKEGIAAGRGEEMTDELVNSIDKFLR